MNRKSSMQLYSYSVLRTAPRLPWQQDEANMTFFPKPEGDSVRITCARLVRFESTRRPVSPPVDSSDPSQSRTNNPYILPGRRRALPLLARLFFFLFFLSFLKNSATACKKTPDYAMRVERVRLTFRASQMLSACTDCCWVRRVSRQRHEDLA